MGSTAILLVLASALVHAGWNFLGKRHGTGGAYFACAVATGFIVLAPFLVVWREMLASVPAVVWIYLIPSGLFQGMYFLGLSGAYQNEDLSVAYPVARAIPVLLVPIIASILSVLLGPDSGAAQLSGRGVPSVPALTGIGSIIAGLLVIPRGGLKNRIRRTTIRHRWGWYAVLAGIGTTGYSLIDDGALRLLRETGFLTPIQATIIYSAFQGFSTAVFLSVFGIVCTGWRGYRDDLRRTSYRSAATAGVSIVLAYGLVLLAYGFATNVGYVVAFRQVSLPIGTLLGVFVLREHVSVPRVVGTVLIVVGLVLVGVG